MNKLKPASERAKRGGVGASNPTFYVDATSGSDSNSGLTAPAAWQTIAKVNGLTFQPGDRILLKCGEMWREQLTMPSSGTAERHITIGSYGTGAKPILNGSNVISTWGVFATNQWSATLTTQPGWLFFVDGSGNITWGSKKTSTAALVAEYDWYWASNVIYVFAATDPDTRYASVEGSQRDYGIYSATTAKDYITVDGIDCRQGKIAGVRTNNGGLGWILSNNSLHHFGDTDGTNGHGCYMMGSGMRILNNMVWENGQHGTFLFTNGVAIDDALIEGNIVWDNYHTNIDVVAKVQPVSNVVVRNNISFFTHTDVAIGTEAYHCEGDPGYLSTNVKFYNNVAYATRGIGFLVGPDIDNVDILFNSIAGGSSSGITVLNAETATMRIQNNAIVMSAQFDCITVSDTTNKIVDYNCLWPFTDRLEKNNNVIYTNFATLQGAGFEINGLNADPTYVSASDLHLQAASPCIGAGVAIAEISVDFDGMFRADPPCIGAYEF